MDANQKAELAADFCRSIAEIRYKLKRMFQQKLKDAGIELSFEILEVISILFKYQNLNQQVLADMLSREKSSMTYVIDNMVKAGLVTRRENERDRRNKLIALTQQALQLRERLIPLAMECFTLLSEELTEDQLQTGMVVVERMSSSLDDILGL
jgi:DNA-binding MarR family transcriptional regulator